MYEGRKETKVNSVKFLKMFNEAVIFFKSFEEVSDTKCDEGMFHCCLVTASLLAARKKNIKTSIVSLNTNRILSLILMHSIFSHLRNQGNLARQMFIISKQQRINL